MKDLILERGLPSAPEAERLILGSAMLDAEVLAKVTAILQPRDFATERHRAIFHRMVSMQADGLAVDRITLAQSLMAAGLIELAGGFGYLADLDAIPQIGNLDSYLAILQDKSARRLVMFECAALMDRIADEAIPLTELQAAVMRLGNELGETRRNGTRSIPEVLADSGGILKFLEGGTRDLISTPWQGLNRILGGFSRGDLVVIGGRPGQGKTALAIQIAHSCALGDSSAAVFSLEMPSSQIVYRLLSARSSVPLGRLRFGNLDSEQRGRVQEQLHGLVELGQKFTMAEKSYSLPAIRAALLQHKNLKQLSCVVVDYMQLIEVVGNKRHSNRNAELSEISRGLKLMAREFNVIMVVGSQLSRDHVKANQEPKLSDLRDSGAIESDADIVLFPVEDQQLKSQDESEPQRIDLVIAKNRNGRVGRAPLFFEKKFVRFTDI
jgi:replicative DNA helicase